MHLNFNKMNILTHLKGYIYSKSILRYSHAYTILRSFILILTILYFSITPLYGQNNIRLNTVAVFGIPAGNAGIALTTETADYIKKIFHECGRFMPAGNKQVEDAYRAAAENSGGNVYSEAAKILNADIYVLETVYQIGEFIYLNMDIVPVNTEFENLKRRVRLKSKLKLNIPVKAGIEIALMHKSIPVHSEIVKADGNGIYLINAGEWHGIKSGEKFRTDDLVIDIKQAGRFESLAII